MTRVLLADRDDAERRFIAQALRDDGFEVWDSPDARELLERARTTLPPPGTDVPAALVADVAAPETADFDLMAEVREGDFPFPVILALPAGACGARADTLRLGADAVIDGPLELDALLSAIERVRSGRED
jgi:DNA-binding response OmpR family regulator